MESILPPQAKNLTGKRYGHLIVLSFSRLKNHSAMWNCLCDCGGLKEAKGSDLIRGATRSCGCLKVTSNKINKTKKWEPIIYDENTLKVPLTGNKFALIDKEDIDKVKNYGWYCDKNNYVRNRNGILMHRLIMSCPENKEMDHKDGDNFNNRKNNLKICDGSHNRAGHFKDMTGKRFGKITVISFSHISDRGLAVWNCLCDCGGQEKINGSDLRRGTVSCGCMIGHHEKKWEPIFFDADTLKIPLTRGKYALIDKKDIDLIKDIAWQYSDRGYAKNRANILMHRLIMNCPEDMEVDHINHNRSDNRKKNLRLCTRDENSRNRLMNFNNKCGYKGVCKYGDQFTAVVKYDRKKYDLGVFRTAEEAHNAYCEKAKDLHKEYFCKGVI